MPGNVKTALFPATMYIKLPGTWGSFSGRRPTSDLLAVTDRIVMRAVSTAGVFHTQDIAFGKFAGLCANPSRSASPSASRRWGKGAVPTQLRLQTILQPPTTALRSVQQTPRPL